MAAAPQKSTSGRCFPAPEFPTDALAVILPPEQAIFRPSRFGPRCGLSGTRAARLARMLPWAMLALWAAATPVFTATAATAASRSGQPLLAAYVHIPSLFSVKDDIPSREQKIAHALDRARAAGLGAIMPYANTSSGKSLYPSRLIPEQVYPGWDALGVVVREARRRGLAVYPAIATLISGHDRPAGILAVHQDWALRDRNDQRTGTISPANPAARRWVVDVLLELVARYKPCGVLLDYLRFNNRPIRLDPDSAAQFARQYPDDRPTFGNEHFQAFKEAALTELARKISLALRRDEPRIKIAIYSWGAQVVSRHRIAQDWRTWAARGYVDMVNVSGYCYPANYGKRYLDVFARRMRDAVEINRQLASPVEMTLCLGIATSHGKIRSADDIDDYLRLARQAGMTGVVFFTLQTLDPYLDAVVDRDLFRHLTGRSVEKPPR